MGNYNCKKLDRILYNSKSVALSLHFLLLIEVVGCPCSVIVTDHKNSFKQLLNEFFF